MPRPEWSAEPNDLDSFNLTPDGPDHRSTPPLLTGSGSIDLFLHRGAPRFERRRQPLRLLFQVVAALAEQVADVALRFPGLLLRLLQALAATLDEVLARLLAAPGREEQSHCGARQTTEQEPSQISRRVVSTLSWHCLSS